MNRNSPTLNARAHHHVIGDAARRCLRPKRELMICLGWLRLFHAITAIETRNS